MATTKITSRSLETGAALANLNAGASVALTVPVTSTNYNPGTNVATFLATPTSANLLAAVTDETGTGSLVFATSPTITTPTIAQINGGTAANDDITIQGTTNATRTTSYVNLQPSGGNVGIGTATPSAILHTIALTEQMRIGYDAANYTSLTVTSAGNVTRNNTGTFVSQTINGSQALYQGFSSSAVYMTIGGTTRGDSNQGKFNLLGTGVAADAPIYVIWHTTDDSAAKNAGLITKTRMGSRYLKTYQTIGQNDNSFGNAGLVQFTALEYSNNTYTTIATPTEFSGWNYQYYNGAAYESLIAVRKTGVGVGVVSPNAKAKLQVDSTTQGFLPPRMDTTQRNAIASPPAGLVIYNTTTSNLNSYSGSAWVELVDSADLGANVATFLATPTSANLLAAVTDETGTGSLVFGTSPTLTTPTINSATIGTAATFNATTWTFGVGGAEAFGAALAAFQRMYNVYAYDDFLSGTTISGTIGSLGWGGGGTGTFRGHEANHPGIYRTSTTGTGYLNLPVFSGNSTDALDGLTTESCFRLTDITNIKFLFGLSYVTLYLGGVGGARVLTFDPSLSANWRLLHFAQTGGVTTYVDTGIPAVANDWVICSLAYANGSTVCKIRTTSNPTEVTVTNTGSYASTSNFHAPQFVVVSTSGTKSMDVDSFLMYGSTTRL